MINKITGEVFDALSREDKKKYLDSLGLDTSLLCNRSMKELGRDVYAHITHFNVR